MLTASIKTLATAAATAAALCTPLVAQSPTGQNTQPPASLRSFQPPQQGTVHRLGDRRQDAGNDNQFQHQIPDSQGDVNVPDVLQMPPKANPRASLKPLQGGASVLPGGSMTVPVKPSWAPNTQASQPYARPLKSVTPPPVASAPAVASAPDVASAPSSLPSLTSSVESLIKTEITSPKFINVNKAAPFQITMTNTGDAYVRAIQFTAVLPAHAELVSATPTPSDVDGQKIQFDIERLGPRDSQQIVLLVKPTEKAPIDVLTAVKTENEQKLLVAVRQPQLSMVINGPQQTNVGQTVTHELIVSNIGDGEATDVQLHTEFPEQMIELKSSLPETIRSIAPGKSVTVSYESQAIAAGDIELTSTAQSDDGSQPKVTTAAMTVYEPKLQISAIGPKANFVNRNGMYTLNLENAGEVDVTDVRVALAVPAGMKITTISREANVDAQQGVLQWSFDRIPVGSTEQIQMMAVVTEQGKQICNFVVDSHETSEKQIQLSTEVSTRADIAVQLKNESGPVQTGGKATFLVDLSNRGSREALDVNVKIELPDSLQAVPMDGQKVLIEGNTIVYAEPQISPGKQTTFQFTVQGNTSGEHVVRSITRIGGSERRTMSEDTVFVYEVDEARVSESLTPTVIQR